MLDLIVILNLLWSLKKSVSPVGSRKFSIKKLKDPAVAETCRVQFAAKTGGLLNNGNEFATMWGKVKSAFNNTATSVLGYSGTQKQKKWISVETYTLVDERRTLKAHKQDSVSSAKHHNYLCREIRGRCVKDREDYINGICQEVEEPHLQKKSRKV